MTRWRVPRACGDGPACKAHCCSGYCVFPAHAGMDRHHRGGVQRLGRVPRACGDGPQAEGETGLADQPDLILNVAKQRHGDFSGHIKLWMDRSCYRLVEDYAQRAAPMVN